MLGPRAMEIGALLSVVLAGEVVWALSQSRRQRASAATPGATPSISSVARIGNALFTTHAFAFEVTSILILVAMVGAVVHRAARKHADDGLAEPLSRCCRRAVLDRHGRRVPAPQPDHDPAVDRDHAERGEPDVRRGRPLSRHGRRPDHHVLRHDRRRRRGGRRPRAGHRALPAPGDAQSRRVHDAEMVRSDSVARSYRGSIRSSREAADAAADSAAAVRRLPDQRLPRAAAAEGRVGRRRLPGDARVVRASRSRPCCALRRPMPAPCIEQTVFPGSRRATSRSRCVPARSTCRR